ncbi:MAG: potassium-transporting ATPase subunit KdpA, partial [Anaerolineae bacterium]|nr:potassium-transporting ATPase subunit KdpA [Phycisphaerae bacterium]
MSSNGLFQVFLFVGILIALVKPLGLFMARVYEGRAPLGLRRVIGPIERLVYRLCGVRSDDEMNWK